MCIPFAQRATIDAPLHVIAAAVARLHLPRGHPLALEQPPPPSGYMRVSLWPAQLQRAAIGLAVAASHRLATAPASVHVSARTTWRWRTRVLRRIMGDHVARIQVQARLRAVNAAFFAYLCFDERCSELWEIAGSDAPSNLFSWQHDGACTLFTSCSSLLFLQAAAAARIARAPNIKDGDEMRRPDIIAAAESGDLALVADHLTVDSSLVRANDSL
jgi:hypothetical protein